jgi:hypothetical protein
LWAHFLSAIAPFKANVMRCYDSSNRFEHKSRHFR